MCTEGGLAYGAKNFCFETRRLYSIACILGILQGSLQPEERLEEVITSFGLLHFHASYPEPHLVGVSKAPALA